MTAQKPGQRPEQVPARDEAVSAGGSAPACDTPPMSELLASCAAAAAVSRPPSDPEPPAREDRRAPAHR
ncbi:hypothetical protein FM076_20495 [Streptomyces albus subsp. chlorinus]|uniref:hypothetical protein n=1 Tax=Streptomyces albus TaxID=1888 RepID=UPI00157011D2|nr:hypothetical protein [Streptomyces albus]NSC23401.1 hypothetical protein [Streptomyces albus subsp. chlorinus]